ncbi:MAG: Ig domain-containing protein [Desulfobacteraceae bacterium]|nr:Ig domain-containing protein [Desulfobacteraceae bacterium]
MHIDANEELVWKPSFDQKDWSDFIIEISDGYDTDKISFSLFVNHPVDIESAANPLTTVGAKYQYRPVLKDKNDGFYVYWYGLSPRVTDWKRSGIYETKIIDDVVLDAQDPNGDPLVFKSVRLPRNAKFYPETGILTWSPKKSQRGVNDIVLEVVDSWLEHAAGISGKCIS